MQIVEMERQLQAFPLNEPVAIDGESVYLRVDQDGAELGVRFLESVTSQQLREALQLGFQNALEFDAGWALTPDGRTLLLAQWLPGASGWTDVPESLEQLLNQVELLRTLDAFSGFAAEPVSSRDSSRDEQRIRSKLMRGE